MRQLQIGYKLLDNFGNSQKHHIRDHTYHCHKYKRSTFINECWGKDFPYHQMSSENESSTQGCKCLKI